MATTEDLEQLGRRLSPQVLRALADHLGGIEGPARSELVLHHGPDGIAIRAACYKRVRTVDVRLDAGATMRRAEGAGVPVLPRRDAQLVG